jgi:hypothetical protein
MAQVGFVLFTGNLVILLYGRNQLVCIVEIAQEKIFAFDMFFDEKLRFTVETWFLAAFRFL